MYAPSLLPLLAILAVTVSSLPNGQNATPSACLAIRQFQNAAFAKDTSASEISVPAQVAYDCLTSIPLHEEDALDFLAFWRPYLQFQTSVNTLKSPPPSYQQPATDLLGGLENIKKALENKTYKNQYEFEAATLELLHSAHEGHLQLTYGANAIFLFRPAPNLQLISLSPNTTALPQIYVSDDLTAAANATSWAPSPISAINNQDPTQWLMSLESREQFIEPHTVYNSFFYNAARDLDGSAPSSELFLLTLYPGSPDFNLTFTNGTTLSTSFEAVYSPAVHNFANITSGSDVYQQYIRRKLAHAASPGASSTSAATSATSSSATASATHISKGLSRNPPPYPWNPVVVQKGLDHQPGSESSGYVTGYFLEASSLAVLSIPSFAEAPPYIESFADAIAEFLNQSVQAGMKKVIVDLQGNGGGTALLAIEAFKLFFPQINPFAGDRLRAHPAANKIGQSFSQDRSGASVLDGTPWYAPAYLDANGKEFPAWKALYGPVQVEGDTFTNTIRYNYSNTVFTQDLGKLDVYGYGNLSTNSPAPYRAQDIVLLTDGYCASTCAIFAEQMHTEAGVRSVVLGGLPQTGPMQAVAGTRGANDVKLTELQADIDVVVEAANSTLLKLFPAFALVPRSPYQGTTGSVNLKDQIRRNNQQVPLQYIYEAADCRLFYTKEMVMDYSVLWQTVAEAVWGSGSCADGSTGQPSAQINDTQTTAPPTGNAGAALSQLDATGLGARVNGLSLWMSVALGGFTFGGLCL